MILPVTLAQGHKIHPCKLLRATLTADADILPDSGTFHTLNRTESSPMSSEARSCWRTVVDQGLDTASAI